MENSAIGRDAQNARPTANRQLRLVERRCYALPVSKDQVRRETHVHADAIQQASDEFYERYGKRPTAEMIEVARSGAIAPWSGTQGSRLRWTTRYDIHKRLAKGIPLTRRQACFLEEARQWQEKAFWFSQRALVLANGSRSAQYRAELDYVRP